MSEAPEIPKRALGSRRRTGDDADDDAERPQETQPVATRPRARRAELTTDTQPMSEAAEAPKRALGSRRRKGDDADDDAENDAERPQETQPVATRPRARAPRAELTATLPSGLHADPVAMAAGSPIAAKAPLLGAERPAAGGGSQAVDIFETAYDSLSTEEFHTLLGSITRQEVEKRIVENEQLWRKHQQAPQVERFLDAAMRQGAGSPCTSGSNAEEMCGYRYNDMLQRLFVALNRNKESSAMSERNQLPVPELERIGKKKVIITNFGRICQAFHRPIEDVKDYIEKELSVGGNLDSNDALILKYEIQKATAFDKILIRYLDDFVKCNSCHKIDTTLTKEGRRMELRCNWCTATRSVQAVGSATYSAQVGKRSKARMQALTL